MFPTQMSPGCLSTTTSNDADYTESVNATCMSVNILAALSLTDMSSSLLFFLTHLIGFIFLM